MIKLEEQFTAGTNQIGDKTNKKLKIKKRKNTKEIKEEKFKKMRAIRKRYADKEKD